MTKPFHVQTTVTMFMSNGAGGLPLVITNFGPDDLHVTEGNGTINHTISPGNSFLNNVASLFLKSDGFSCGTIDYPV